MGKIKISVIIPAYNRADMLPCAIMSALDQGRDDIEIIVIDDASSDNTPDVLGDMADPRIRYIRRAVNGGVSAARNDGLRVATGNYIAFLDSDDAWVPGKIAAQLGAFEEYKTAGMVFVNAREVSDGKTGFFIDPSERSRIVYGPKERSSGIFPGAIMVTSPSGWMLKRSVVDEIGFFDEAMTVWEDCDYFTRIAKRFDICFVNASLMIRHFGPGDQLSRNIYVWHESKKVFYAKHKACMNNDKHYIFRFYKGMGKDCLILKDRDNAAKWFIKALRINSFALNLYGKLIGQCWPLKV